MSDYLTDLNEHYKKVRGRLSPKPVAKPAVIKPLPAPVVAPEPVVVAPAVEEVKKEYPMKGVFLPPELKEQIRQVLRECDMQWENAISNRKTNAHLIVRAKIYSMLRNNGWSLKRIGKICGNKDHSTIFHALKHSDKWGVEK